MASLWNFLARLTSRRRAEPQQLLPNPDLVDQSSAARLRVAETVFDDAASVPERAHAGVIAGEPSETVDSVYIAASVAGEPDIQASLPTPRTPVPRRHGNRAADAGAEPQLANALTVTAQAIRLDDDIKLLRSELVSKLRLQNAQLKTMLERFER